MDVPQQKLNPKELNNLVLHGIQHPVVFHHMIKEWPASGWTPEDLASVLGDKQVKIRIGLKEAKCWESSQWEASCSYETTTLAKFCEWLKPDEQQDNEGENPLLNYDPAKYWCYMDYKYMAQLFEDNPDILKAIQWSDFGFSDRDGLQSTVWIGSEGATTPGHYDTYGCNLVAQIYGRKTWHLFPPIQSDALYQTRIPYEESSVFSPINISKPDLNKYPQFSTATPYLVTLEPGDVLYVPRHWWHFVETVDTSISVNTWIEMETDHKDRFHEAITRSLVSGILPSSPIQQNSKWLNPTEELCDTTTNMKYLKNALENMIHHETQPGQRDAANLENMIHHETQTGQRDAANQQTSLKSAVKMLHKTTSQVDQGLHETTSPHPIEIKCNEIEEVVSVSTTYCPPTKRKKCTAVSKTCGSGRELPEWITIVPCLGQIYRERQDHIDNADLETRSGDNRTEQVSELATQSSICGTESQDNSTTNPSHTGRADETSGILQLFLQSLTHPQVVHHIADMFCKKMKENSYV